MSVRSRWEQKERVIVPEIVFAEATVAEWEATYREVIRMMNDGRWTFYNVSPTALAQTMAWRTLPWCRPGVGLLDTESVECHVAQEGDDWTCLACDRGRQDVAAAWRCCPRHFCEECGEGFNSSDGADACCEAEEFYDTDPYSLVRSWSYSPDSLTFRGKDIIDVSKEWSKYPPAPTAEPYLGLEIEVEGVHCSRESLAFLWDRSGLGWSTDDGSLSDEGVELCTSPMTYDAICRSSLADTLKDLRDEGGRAWHTGTCGLHIHISRAAFATRSHAWRFAHLHTGVLADEMRSLSGREDYEWCKWPDHYTPTYLGQDPMGLMATKIIARKALSTDRYVAVNVPSDDASTIELRFWRGNLNPTHVLGAAALCDAIYQWSRSMSLRDVREADWEAFTKWAYHVLPARQVAHIATLCHRRGVTFDDPSVPMLFTDAVRVPVLAESDV